MRRKKLSDGTVFKKEEEKNGKEADGYETKQKAKQAFGVAADDRIVHILVSVTFICGRYRAFRDNNTSKP
jgi:hypothetical protein